MERLEPSMERLEAAGGCCSSLCGVCPSCVFAPEPPGSARRSWTASDGPRRRFVVDLLLRCTGADVLKTVRGALGSPSSALLNYGRSEGKRIPSRKGHRGSDGTPPDLDLQEVLDWFARSSDLTQSRYLLRLFLFCDSELLRMAANLASVLLVRQERGILHTDGSCQSSDQHDEDSENPALMVVPGSSESMSGVGRYRDFISCLPGHLSKRILGLFDARTLRRCQKVCPTWRHFARETLAEVRIRKSIQEQFKVMTRKYSRMEIVNHTHANFIDVPIPLKDEEEADPRDQKVDIFNGAYAQIPTKTLRMEERNVYCGTYFTQVLLNKEDPHRVMDYRKGSLLALGSKDRMLHLFYVGCEVKSLKALKGHSGSIRAVVLCEDRDLVITGSRDSSIRCWELKTGECWAILYGHCEAVNSLDVHGDRLVSGAKDHLVRVWNLQTKKRLVKCNFKHPTPVQCVKITSTSVCSSCERGLVRVWDLESAQMLAVLDAHQSSVRRLFLDDLHLLSADVDGRVMAWSLNGAVKQPLRTFNHPGEVKSLTLVFLRVLTGCVDGKVRVFHFLTGDCLRVLPVEAETVGMLSAHFYDDGILVNSKSRISRLQFAKVFWDYGAEGSRARAGSPEEFSDHLEKTDEGNVKTSAESKQLHQSAVPPSSTKPQVQDKGGSVVPSALPRAKGLNEKMKKRVPHQPLTRDPVPPQGQSPQISSSRAGLPHS